MKQNAGEILTFPTSVETFFLKGFPTNFHLVRDGEQVKLICDYVPGDELPYVVWVRKVSDKFKRKWRLRLRDQRAFMAEKKLFYSGVRLPDFLLNEEAYTVVVFAFRKTIGIN